MEAQWLVWLAVALVAGVVEIFTLSLVFAMVAGGALAAAGVAAVTDSPALAVLTFAAATGLLLVAVRPPLVRYSRGIGPGAHTGAGALVGLTAEVLAPVGAHDGRVKLNGEVWSARTEGTPPEGIPLEVGSRVRVTRIDGATAVVDPLPPHAALSGGASSDGPEPFE